MSVKVAVRVRPFNTREKELNSKLCVEMNGATTTLTNPKDAKTKNFTFDYSFWSHDGFQPDENGFFIPTNNRYADQRRVYDLVGKEVLDNAWQGYHCCLFAYGQTGSGKSYSMVGYGANKGIVPITMQQIFERTSQNTNANVSFEINFCMLEIYNEKVQDLLLPIEKRTNEGLKVREHQKFGVYVEGLSKHPVDSYAAIEAKMEQGSKNRSIAVTEMNDFSSRAHTIMTIEFKRIEIVNNKKTEKFAVINLVDLAGSEKISKTKAAGVTRHEGCAINKSLSTLGLVIAKLAEKSTSKRNVVVPYRDSVLTRILQNALGGNSKTLMICAISPASDNYEETLSTLRYADQAKKIKNNAVVNESEQDKIIRELREENERLRVMLRDRPEMMPGKYTMIDEESMRRYKEIEEQLQANAHMMQQYEQNFEQKLAEAKLEEEKEKEKMADEEVDTTKPYLVTLNEDPLLSGKVLHSLARERILIGRRNAKPTPDIVLGGIGIKPQHAEIFYDEGKCVLQPCDRDCGEQVHVNGENVYEAIELFHNDRVIFGTNSTFVFKNPGKENESPNMDKYLEEEIDWEFAQSELVQTMVKEKRIRFEEMNKEREKEVEEKIRIIEDRFSKEREDGEIFIQKLKENFEEKMKEIENKLKQESESQKVELERREAEKDWRDQLSRFELDRLMKEKERERMQKEVQEESSLKRFKAQEKIQLEHKLAKHLSQITELNLIAKELRRDITFSVKLVYNFVTGSELQYFRKGKSAKTKIQILVHNREVNDQYTWSMSKFINRYFVIRDLLEQHYEGEKLPDKNTEEDPFWDPPEAHLIGQGFLCLESLAYQIDNPATLHIVNNSGPIGKLNVTVLPLNEKGEPLKEEDDLVDDLGDLISRRFDFAVMIGEGELPENVYRDTYCQYSMLESDNTFKTYRTSTVNGNTGNPDFQYSQHHRFMSVSEGTLNYMLNHNLKIEIYGFEVIKQNPTQQSEKVVTYTPNAYVKGLGTSLKGGSNFGEESERARFSTQGNSRNSISANSDSSLQYSLPKQSGRFAVNSKVASLQAVEPVQKKPEVKPGVSEKSQENDNCNMF